MNDMNKKPLYIPPTKKLKGLKIHCYECGTTVDATCKKTGAKIQNCKHGADHVFKAYAHVPGTSNARKTKKLSTRDIEEARRLTLEFQREIKNGSSFVPGMVPHDSRIQFPAPFEKEGQGKKETKTYNLLELMKQYVGYQHNENVPEFKQRLRSKKHLEDVERTLKYFVGSLVASGYQVETLRVDHIDDHMVGAFLKYLLDHHKLSNSSYNRGFETLKTFYNYLIREGYQIRNPFASIRKRPTKGNKKTIQEGEYMRLLEIVQKPELGIQILSTGEKKYHYKPWMKDAIELGLLTGRRNEEIVELTWNEVHTNEEGVPIYIRVPDFKANRALGNTAETLKYVYIPITKDLRNLLDRLGYTQSKGTNKYILAPDAPMKRSTVNASMSYAFKHYYDQLNTGRSLSFKCLRKTYISQLTRFMGSAEGARQITRHSDTEVMEKHYVDDQYIAMTANGFSMFADAETASKEVEILKGKHGREKQRGLGY